MNPKMISQAFTHFDTKDTGDCLDF